MVTPRLTTYPPIPQLAKDLILIETWMKLDKASEVRKIGGKSPDEVS